jgi:hypothetical protein
MPVYKAADMTSRFCINVECIMSEHQDAVIITAGDINQLDCSNLETDCGLSQMVDKPTRCSAILDKCSTNRPDLFTAVSVIDSVVKTNDEAVILKSVTADLEDPSGFQKMKFNAVACDQKLQ